MKLNRTELYELANALWWAQMECGPESKFPQEPGRLARWYRLETLIREEAYGRGYRGKRKNNGRTAD